MKALKYIMTLAAAPMLWACSADMGTDPGTDPQPAVTLYTYAPAEGNPDNDVTVRFVTNSRASSVKYLLLPSSDAATLDEGQLLSKVESEGKPVENLGSNSYADITLTDIHGAYTIAAVANGTTLGNKATFTGLSWNLIKEGVFYLNNSALPVESTETALEVCSTDPKLYRIRDAFGEGYSLKLNLLNFQAEDEGGKFTLFRVQDQATPWTFGDYGQIFVYDVGYWQGNEGYVTDLTNYCNYLYESGAVDVCLVWHVAAGYINYGYSSFVPYD
ncbi:MAG: hypothetical protein K2N35_06185 [Muribaculaceae bacterium]|nr:hypothetical protein [Muribaculaceae bacterium]